MTRSAPSPFGRLGVEQLEARDVPSVTTFVTHLYQDVLGRPPDAAGYNAWVGQLASGAITPEQAAIGFVTSVEYRTDVVVSYYHAQLGRTPSAAEVQGYVSALVAGASQDDLRASFFGSEEFFSRNGRSNSQFVIQLYQQILGRVPTVAEVNGWVTALAQTGAIARSWPASSCPAPSTTRCR